MMPGGCSALVLSGGWVGWVGQKAKILPVLSCVWKKSYSRICLQS